MLKIVPNGDAAHKLKNEHDLCQEWTAKKNKIPITQPGRRISQESKLRMITTSAKNNGLGRRRLQERNLVEDYATKH